MRRAAFVLGLAVVLAGGAGAQERQQTLADIRQELTVLYVEIQRLRREFSTTGAPSPNLSGNSVLERVDAIEAELQRLTSLTEELNARVDRIVSDGSNQIGDLEFRLCELEAGCDIAQLPETTTLGGDAPAPQTSSIDGAAADAGAEELELAVGEQADFDTATEALAKGDFAGAAALFARFNDTYPGSPFAAQAHLSRGSALEQLGDTREAARAYLASFTGDSTGPVAPEALTRLGAALGRLGQTDQACITLGEVSTRFPSSVSVADAETEMSALGCL